MKDDIIGVVTTILDTYKDDEYIKEKFQKFMVDHLPNQVQQWKTDQQRRLTRNEELAKEHDAFIEVFLRRHTHFYNPQNEKFFSYNGREFKHITEDNITQKISNTIDSESSDLSSWRKKTKMNILKRVKDKFITRAIPESETIQHVLKLLYPSLFIKRNEAKYFLCVLGDNILKKYSVSNQQTTSCYHFIDSKAKTLLRDLEYYSNHYFSTACSTTFKHKHHDHLYETCRLITILPCVQQEQYWKNNIKNSALDILCVACHYSNRYGSADQFLETLQTDFDLKDHILYLKDNSQGNITKSFYNEYLVNEENVVQDNETTAITWKDITFLWKQFLESHRLPNIMFMQVLKQELIQYVEEQSQTQGTQVSFDESNDTFIGVTSKLMPNVQCFLSFWQGTMIQDDSENYMEIDEIAYLYNDWCKTNGNQVIQNERLVELIQFYYPNVEWQEEKYIHGYKNKLWNKQTDMIIALDAIKSDLGTHNMNVYDAYEHYCKYHKNIKLPNLPVSKVYFEHMWENL